MRLSGRLLHGVANAFDRVLRSSRILVSTCHDVFSNLAMEDWIYANVGFSSSESVNGDCKSVVLLWRNRPCVVVGRHQNCWVESNVHEALADGVEVARRRSGGGTVYHDLGNVNCTVFTNRKDYNRKRNLNVIAVALRETWNLDVIVTPRDDLLLNNRFKISGTAAKLGGKVAYHHCTLLLKADLNNVQKYLCGMQHGVESKATASVRATVTNLSDVDANVTFNCLVESLSKAFMAAEGYHTSDLWTYVDPTSESIFPGIHDLCSQLKQWEWIYGHTPKFQIRRSFNCHILQEHVQVSVDLEVEHGLVKHSEIRVDGCKSDVKDDLTGISAHISSVLNGTRFWPSDMRDLEEFIVDFRTNSDSDLIVWTRSIFKCIQDALLGK